jgi:hypothetical protein
LPPFSGLNTQCAAVSTVDGLTKVPVHSMRRLSTAAWSLPTPRHGTLSGSKRPRDCACRRLAIREPRCADRRSMLLQPAAPRRDDECPKRDREPKGRNIHPQRRVCLRSAGGRAVSEASAP